MIAAQKHCNQLPVACVLTRRNLLRHADLGDVRHALDVRGRRDVEEGRHICNRGAAGCMHQFRLAVSRRFHLGDWIEARCGLFQICRVAADWAACNQVFARFGIHHELLRLRAAHGPRIGLDGHELKSAACEDRPVHLIMPVEALVQASHVDVEGVRILHDELAHAQQASFGPRLVAKLGLDLVPDLRQLLVAAQLATREGGHDLFVGHAQAQLRALTVLEAEHVVAHGRPAATLRPRLFRQDARQIELLPDLVHLIAHDGDDLI